MPFNRIAEAYVEIKAKGAKATRVAIDGVSDSVRKLKNAGDRSLGAIGDRLDKATEGARKFQGAIGGVLGIVVAVGAAAFTLGRALYELSLRLRDGTTKAREFLDELRFKNGGLRDAATEAEAVRARLEEINSLLANRETAAGRVAIAEETGRTSAQGALELEKERLALAEALSRLNIRERRVAEEREQARIQEAESAERSVAAANESLRIQRLLSEAEQEQDAGRRAELQAQAARLETLKEIADVEAQIAERRKLADEENQTGVIAALEERVRLLRENLDVRLDAIAKARDAQIKADKDAADAQRKLDDERAQRERERIEEEKRARIEAARAVADANTAALNSLVQQQASAFQSILDSNTQQFSRLTDLMAAAVDRLEQVRRNTKP